MAYNGSNWKAGETFFSPMGSGVGAVAGSTATPPPSRVGSAVGTPSKLAAQELYWRWFQIADTGEDGLPHA